MLRNSILIGYAICRICRFSTFALSTDLPIPLSRSTTSVLRPQAVYSRIMSSSTNKTINYDGVLAATSDADTYIIDVREPDELKQTGTIPSSINIPLSEVEHALKTLTDAEFKQKYGRTKPKETTRIIFSCRSGKRAGIATEAALKQGYVNSMTYLGSWIDWEKHNKK